MEARLSFILFYVLAENLDIRTLKNRGVDMGKKYHRNYNIFCFPRHYLRYVNVILVLSR